MRVWEFEDKKEAPSDLVLEQDFILRVRRMQRTGLPSLVLNFLLNAIESLKSNRDAIKEVQKKLKAYAVGTNGSYYEMSNGDVFLVWENPGEARLVSSRAIDAALDDYRDNTNVFLLTFRMPENYALLRERTNEYVEEARAKAAALVPQEKVDDGQGHLTARTVEHIEHVLENLDIKRLGRSQNIYRDTKGVFSPIGEEYFISFEELRREYFPKIDSPGPGHFFFAVCSLFDQKLLSALTESFAQIQGRKINLNLSITSIMGATFTQFVRVVPKRERQNIGFELHCGDLFQDFSLTLSAIEVLRKEGFRVTIDSIAPTMAPYLDLERFPVDSLKIDAAKDRVPQFADPTVHKALERVTATKLIFNHCDSPEALKIGRELGVTVFQGWLIDDLISNPKP